MSTQSHHGIEGTKGNMKESAQHTGESGPQTNPLIFLTLTGQPLSS